MELIIGDDLDEERCRALFAGEHSGHLGLRLDGLPVVVPVLYSLDDKGFLIEIAIDHVAYAVSDSVVALQSDGWAEDFFQRWTAVAVGRAQRVSPDLERPLPLKADGSHLFRLTPFIVSGRWIREDEH
jgi:Pyridoxamine 5'-phosphate oxidase